jgi:nucleoside-diphosphate-sugar epimerase
VKILITGSEGFIGRHFAKHYSSHELDLVDIKSGNDCRDLFRLSDKVYDLVIHCAANVGGRVRIDGDPLAVAENLAIDSDMFRWAVRTKQKKIIFFSSSAAYPIHLQKASAKTQRKLSEIDLDLSNNLLGFPDQTYGWAKLTGEYLASFARSEGIDVYVFRPFSGYGPDQDMDYPFPSFINRAVNYSGEFEIWGDGTASRDFIHVDDIVKAVLAVLEANYQEPVNLATGRCTSFNELALLCCRIAGIPEPNLVHDLSKPTGAWHRVGEPTRMLKFHSPSISLEEGIELSIKLRGISS